MAERRSAEDALALTQPVEEFIARGVPNGSSDHSKPQTESGEDASDVKQPGGESESGDNEPARRKPRSRKNGTRRRQKSPVSESVPEVLLQTYAKATVQKTVRFQPTLIAEFDALVQKQQLAGEKPTTFQEAQNEALSMWLKQSQTLRQC